MLSFNSRPDRREFFVVPRDFAFHADERRQNLGDHRRRRPGRARARLRTGLRGIDCVLIEKRDGAITVPKQSMVLGAQHGILPPLGRRHGGAHRGLAGEPSARFRLSRQHARHANCCASRSRPMRSATRATTRRRPPAPARRSISIRSWRRAPARCPTCTCATTPSSTRSDRMTTE